MSYILLENGGKVLEEDGTGALQLDWVVITDWVPLNEQFINNILEFENGLGQNYDDFTLGGEGVPLTGIAHLTATGTLSATGTRKLGLVGISPGSISLTPVSAGSLTLTPVTEGSLTLTPIQPI